jgi:large subunit ribosomal protein L14
MIQIGTNLQTVDNSGAKIVKCIGGFGGYKQRKVSYGAIITVAVQKLRVKRRTLVKVKKGQVLQALVVRTKKVLNSSSSVLFFENSVVLLNKQKKLIGTRIFGSLPKSLRYTKLLKISFLARGLIV